MDADDLLVQLVSDFTTSQDNARFVGAFYRSINEAQSWLCNKRGGMWGFQMVLDATVSTVDGTRSVSLPATFRTLINNKCVRDTTNGTQLTFITLKEWWDREYEDGSTEGEPSLYWVVGKTMYFSPIPDDAYTIKYSYYRLPAAISANAKTLLVPDEYEELILSRTARALKKRGFSSFDDIILETTDEAELLRDAIHDDNMRYRAARAGLQRSTHTSRH